MHLRTPIKAMTTAGAVITLIAALAGCSSSSSSPSSSSSSSASSSSSSDDSGTFAVNSSTLVVSSLPGDNGADPNAALDSYLGKMTGLTIKYVPTTSYSALIAAAVAGQLDVAVFSGATYVTAVNKGAKLDVVSAEITSPGLKVPGYYSDPIVPKAKASQYQTVSQFKGKTICFVDPTSTSGYFYPLMALKAGGIDVTPTGTTANGDPTFSDFTAYFAGSHPKSVQAVSSGQCQVGFAEDAESEAPNSGVAVVKDAKTVGDGLGRQLVPGSPVVISSTLPASMKAKLTSILGTVSPETLTQAGFPPPASEDFYGILPETSAFYDPIYKACQDASIKKAAPAVCG